MVDLLEVPLLSEFVISRPALLGDDPCLIHLLLQMSEDVGQLDVLFVDLWDLGHLADVEVSFGLELKPFLGEAVQCSLHAELDEEIPEELITVLDMRRADLTEVSFRAQLRLLDS